MLPSQNRPTPLQPRRQPPSCAVATLADAAGFIGEVGSTSRRSLTGSSRAGIGAIPTEMVFDHISTIGLRRGDPLTAPRSRVGVTVFSIVGGLVVVQLSIRSLLGLSEVGLLPPALRENVSAATLQTMEPC